VPVASGNSGVLAARCRADGYASRAFRDACARLGVDHRRTRPYTPRTNGEVERFI
jgi:transposase InsO family protein